MISIPCIDLLNFELKYYSLIKRNANFFITLFKYLIFEELCVLLFCMEKILPFALPAKFCVLHGDLISRF